MKRMNDPFPPTPERFHRRVEATLQSLEDRHMKQRRIYSKTAMLIAAVVAALLTVTAVAAVIGHSGFRQKLNDEGAGEVAELVQEVHRSAGNTDSEGFDFSIDEIIWEAGDLYISYSLSVPKDGNYLVAMSNPTLNGDKLVYDAKGWTTPKFIDPADDSAPSVLLMGGGHRTACNELWTFAVDPRLKDKADNRLGFKAVLYRTTQDLKGQSDWTDMLDPPNTLSDNALSAIKRAEYVAERAISMDLKATWLDQTLFNDVAEHDFDVDGLHLHIDDFRMTHLGITVKYTLSLPGGARHDRDDMAAFNDFLDKQWRFGTVDGKALGYSLGGNGSAGLDRLDSQSPVYHCSWSDSVILSLKDFDQIVFAPVTIEDDAEGRQLPAVYDMAHAIRLTPVFSQSIAEREAKTTPEPTLEPGEDISR